MEHHYPVPVTVQLAGSPQLDLQPAPESFAALEQEVLRAFNWTHPVRLVFQDMDGTAHLVTSAASYAAALTTCSLQGLLLTLKEPDPEVAHIAAVDAENGRLLCYHVPSTRLKRLELPFLNTSCRVVACPQALVVVSCGSDFNQCYEVTFDGETRCLSPLLTPTKYPTAAFHQGAVHVACGTNKAEKTVKNDACVLRDQWVALPSCSTGRSAASSISVEGGWYVVGGWRPGERDWDNLTVVECFRQGVWTTLPYSLPHPGRLLGLVYMGDNYLFVCGVRNYLLNIVTGESVKRAPGRHHMFRSIGMRDKDSIYQVTETQVMTYSISRDMWTS